jgi:type VI secretion system secreted protein Hcp
MAAYIKFDGVDGETKDKDHKGWSDLVSFAQGMFKPGSGATGASRRRGDVVLDDIQCVKELDKSSPKLAEAVCKGKVFPKVELHMTASYTDAGRVTYYAYELKNVQVVRYTITGNGQAEHVPTEEFSLNFEEIKVTYTENDEKGKKKGNVEYSWKVEEGEK